MAARLLPRLQTWKNNPSSEKERRKPNCLASDARNGGRLCGQDTPAGQVKERGGQPEETLLDWSIGGKRTPAGLDASKLRAASGTTGQISARSPKASING